MTVLIKNIDERLYERLKAKASLEGISLDEAINEAIKLWIEKKSNHILLPDRQFWDAIYEGKYALYCNGKFIGAINTEKEMLNETRKYGKCYGMHKSWLREEEGELIGIF